MGEADEAFGKLDLDAIDKAHKAAEKVGKFEPIFIHNPADGAVPLYPTLPDDLANLIKISHVVFEFLRTSPKDR